MRLIGGSYVQHTAGADMHVGSAARRRAADTYAYILRTYNRDGEAAARPLWPREIQGVGRRGQLVLSNMDESLVVEEPEDQHDSSRQPPCSLIPVNACIGGSIVDASGTVFLSLHVFPRASPLQMYVTSFATAWCGKADRNPYGRVHRSSPPTSRGRYATPLNKQIQNAAAACAGIGFCTTLSPVSVGQGACTGIYAHEHLYILGLSSSYAAPDEYVSS